MQFLKEIKDAHAQTLADLFGDQREGETAEQRIQRAIDEWFDTLYSTAITSYVASDPAVVAKREEYLSAVAAKLEAEQQTKSK